MIPIIAEGAKNKNPQFNCKLTLKGLPLQYQELLSKKGQPQPLDKITLKIKNLTFTQLIR